MSPLEDLQRRLDALADPKVKAWFEVYLKGALPYRGVKTPQVTEALKPWREAHGLGALDDEAQLALATTLLAQPHAEDKFAGILYVRGYLAERLGAGTLLSAVERSFAEGAIGDWSTNDWLCAQVIGPAVVRHGMPAARRVAGWVTAETLWQRRSAAVALRGAAKDPAYHALVAEVVAALVVEDARFVQTGVGWLLADLSRAHPEVAAALFERHFDQLSREVIDRHSKHLPEHAAYKRRKRARRS
jgi:3-methyladenine DNA glycosylase AlkD